jgi:protein-arginine kinase activator protein McsA
MYCDECGVPARLRVIADYDKGPIEDLKMCRDCAVRYGKELAAKDNYIGIFNLSDEVIWNGTDIGRHGV